MDARITLGLSIDCSILFPSVRQLITVAHFGAEGYPPTMQCVILGGGATVRGASSPPDQYLKENPQYGIKEVEKFNNAELQISWNHAAGF